MQVFLCRALHQRQWLIYSLRIEECLSRVPSRRTREHERCHRDHAPAIADMMPSYVGSVRSAGIDRLCSTAFCLQQRVPLRIAEFSAAWCAHCLEYLDQSLVGKTHCGAELEDELCVPEDLCSHFVLIACALEWSQHAARLRHWWQLQVVL